ncbi:hypothetical protein [Halobacillus litoralis]|uniref:Small peptidoglycan-associated lipoprotein n=1 Tax=Halobacillus litoralis TaxID=45668 RepID=A0A410M8V0_9BACI|nr:hypothetical protein [Halobacillus litoralis]QAS51154.1 hypothetical protein HLI_02495 [Halobacillus litoralis]
MLNRILLAFVTILLLAGCFPQSEDVQVFTATPLDYELYLYTEPDKEEEAQNYLSALLDWKMKQNDGQKLEFKQTETNADDLKVSKDQLPVLVVKEKGKTLTTISGENPRKEILMTLENSITFAQK